MIRRDDVGGERALVKLETMTTFSSVLVLISLKMLETASSLPGDRTERK